MKYTKEMILQSPSGYCMPFEEKGKEVVMTLGYGKQKHPNTDEEFFHHGVDFEVHNYLLSALASGIVSGLGTDSIRGLYQIIRYGDYDVSYSHLTNVLATYGENVEAGQVVAVSGNLLHMEVRYKGEELNPIEFLTMIYGNIRCTERGKNPMDIPVYDTIEGKFSTKFDNDQNEIVELMLRFFPTYLNDISSGIYTLPQRTEQSLRNIFSIVSLRNYFYELIPSMENPMGLGQKSIPLAEKVQNLLIEDFLGYLALKHGTYLSTWSDDIKKKSMNKQ